MADGFFGLGHDAIVCSNHDDSNIGNICTTGAHFCKGFMARGIKEGNGLTIMFNSPSTDTLCDPACLGSSNFAFANFVEERGFTMIHMAHDGNDRCPED